MAHVLDIFITPDETKSPGRKLRRGFVSSAVMLTLLLIVTGSSLPRVEGIPGFNVNVKGGDTLTVYIEPAVIGLNTSCNPHVGNQPFFVYVASNITGSSLVQLYTESESDYNLTLGFGSPEPWQIRVGVLTANPDAYSGFRTVEPQGASYFVEMAKYDDDPGTYVLNILVHAEGIKADGSGGFNLPSVFFFAIVLAVALPLGYVNIFAVADAYFRNKAEGVSRQRKIGVAIVIIVSILVVYWVLGAAFAAQPPATGGKVS